jgi:hypothetical protein
VGITCKWASRGDLRYLARIRGVDGLCLRSRFEHNDGSKYLCINSKAMIYRGEGARTRDFPILDFRHRVCQNRKHDGGKGVVSFAKDLFGFSSWPSITGLEVGLVIPAVQSGLWERRCRRLLVLLGRERFWQPVPNEDLCVLTCRIGHDTYLTGSHVPLCPCAPGEPCTQRHESRTSCGICLRPFVRPVASPNQCRQLITTWGVRV